MAVSPTDIKRVKGQGFLLNRGTDNFSGRVITENGVLTAAQMRCLSEAAQTFGSGTLTFTSRLTVELPGIPYEKIEDFKAFIAKEGMVTGGTGAWVTGAATGATGVGVSWGTEMLTAFFSSAVVSLSMALRTAASASILIFISNIGTILLGIIFTVAALTGVKVGSAVRAGLIVGHFSQPPARLSSIQKRS